MKVYEGNAKETLAQGEGARAMPDTISPPWGGVWAGKKFHAPWDVKLFAFPESQGFEFRRLLGRQFARGADSVCSCALVFVLVDDGPAGFPL